MTTGNSFGGPGQAPLTIQFGDKKRPRDLGFATTAKARKAGTSAKPGSGKMTLTFLPRPTAGLSEEELLAADQAMYDAIVKEFQK